MKRLVVTVLICLLCAGAASAAQWPEGLSPARPYTGLRPQDLSSTIGYVMLYPRASMQAAHFCDTLKICLPREDVAVGTGRLYLYTADGREACRVDFSDGKSAAVRPLTEAEMDGLLWGSGVCVEIRLPVSLRFGTTYHVAADEGCIVAANGTLPAPAISSPDAWELALTGDYGIGGLYYASQPTEAPEGQAPENEELVCFDLVLGGDAALAVLYSKDNSVYFDTPEYSGSAEVTGRVLGGEPSWGVVFLDGNGEVLDVLEPGR